MHDVRSYRISKCYGLEMQPARFRGYDRRQAEFQIIMNILYRYSGQILVTQHNQSVHRLLHPRQVAILVSSVMR